MFYYFIEPSHSQSPVYLRKKLKHHQPDVTRIEGRPVQDRDQQYGKLYIEYYLILRDMDKKALPLRIGVGSYHQMFTKKG